MAGGSKQQAVSPEDQVFAELFLDLKSRKKKRLNWIEIAKRCSYLAERHGSIDELAQKLGVSGHLLRSIIRLLDLPLEVQELIRNGDLLYDSAYRLLTISDRQRQVETGRAMVGLPSEKQRELIRYARTFPRRALKPFRGRLANSRAKPRRVDAVLVVFDSDTFDRLKRYSRAAGIPVQEVILRATRGVLPGGPSK